MLSVGRDQNGIIRELSLFPDHDFIMQYVHVLCCLVPKNDKAGNLKTRTNWKVLTVLYKHLCTQRSRNTR